MDIGKLKGWFHLRVKTVDTAREACLTEGDRHHDFARHASGQQAEHEREIAEEYHAAAKDLRDSHHREDQPQAQSMRNVSDSSIHGNSAPTMQANPHINISERTLSIIAFGLAVLVLGISAMTVINQSQSEARTRADMDRQYRFLQELRVRVEDAEMAAKEVNPAFKTPRQPKEH